MVLRRCLKGRFSTALGIEKPVPNQYIYCPYFCFFVSSGAGTSLGGFRVRGSSMSRLFDIVELEGIRGRRVWLLGLDGFWCFGTGASWSTAY